MPRILCFLLFLVAGTAYLHAQSTPTSPGSLRRVLKKTQRDTLRVQHLLDLAEYYVNQFPRGQIDSALYYAEQARVLSVALKHPRGEEAAAFLVGKGNIILRRYSALRQVLRTVSERQQAILLLELVEYNVNLEEDPSVMDSVSVFIDQAMAIGHALHNEKLICLATLQLANLSYANRDVKKGHAMFQQVLTEVRRLHDVEAEALMVFDLADLNTLMLDKSILPELEKSEARIIKFYEEGAPVSNRRRFQNVLIFGGDQMAYSYLFMGNMTKALQVSMQMKTLLENENNPYLNADPYIVLARIYQELKQFEQCIEYFEKAVAITKQKHESIDMRVVRNAVKAWIALKKPEKALAFIDEQMSIGHYTDLGNLRNIAESRGLCYFELGDYDRAEKYYVESVRLAKQMSKEYFLTSCLPVARLYTRMRQYQKARTYLKPLVEQSEVGVPYFVQRDAYQLLYQGDSATGDFTSAIENLKQYKAMNDSMVNEKRNKQVEELKLQYETQRKDHDILLLTKQSELAEFDLQQARFSRNVFIVGGLVLIVLLAMVYSRYQLKLKTNSLLQAKQEKINRSNQQLMQLNEQLHKLLAEKEWLVREIHHRVKNNLQMVVSLLNTQASYLSEGDARLAIQESQLRMQVISLLHQKLYKIDQSSLVEMKIYIPELVSFIRESYKSINHLYFDMAIAPVKLDISQAVPVGLILNEAITNSIKYAFTQQDQGTIAISLETLDDEQVLLTVTDNGSGLPPQFDIKKQSSLGMELMQTLSEQLDGFFSIESNAGVVLRCCFKPMKEERTHTDHADTKHTPEATHDPSHV